MKKVFLALGMVLFLVSSLAFGQEEIEPVVVTGSRIVQALEEIPAPTYVITSEDIEKGHAKTLGELLSTIPGIQTARRGAWTQDDVIYMRGLRIQMLIMVDGVPYYKGSYAEFGNPLDLRSIPLESIDRIEVVKGAGSAIYGSMAAAGVINIITKSSKELETKAVVEGGSDDWERYYVTANATGEKVNAGLWFVNRKEGKTPLKKVHSSITNEVVFDESLKYDEDAGGVRLDFGNLSVRADWGKYEAEWENSYDNYYPYGFIKGALNRQEDEYRRFYVTYAEGGFRGSAYYYKTQKDVNAMWVGEYDDEAWGAEIYKRELWGTITAVWGVSFRREESVTIEDTTMEGKRENAAPFFELSVPMGEVVANLGVRYEHWSVDEAEDQDELTPKLSFNYQTASGQMWYLSAGRFFAMPSLYEIFAPYGGNKNLSPEKGWSYEVGLKSPYDESPWGLGFFYLTMDDKIKWDDKGTIDWSDDTYNNIAEFRAYGVEFQKVRRLSDEWTWIPTVTWTKAEEKETTASPWKKSGMPQWDIASRFVYEKGPWSGELSAHFLGSREADKEKYEADDDYFTIDARISWEKGNDRISFVAYNLTDEEYFIDISGSDMFWGPERRFYLTWEHRF